MKILLPILGLAVLVAISATAQVSVQITMEQEQFLPSEKLPVAVRISNRSGQTLHLGAEQAWLVFNVESSEGFVVVKKAEVPVIGEFDLGSAQVATKWVDLQPYFGLMRSGRYKVTATVRIKDWKAEVASPPKNFDIISGVQLWSQDFGVPTPAGTTNSAPEVRKYTLQQANYLRSQLRLYVLVSDATGSHVSKVIQIGNMVSFSQPETQLDASSNLHILWQSGASSFVYVVLNPDGEIMEQQIYDYNTTRPRLALSPIGGIGVVGGSRRLSAKESANEMLMVNPPAPAPAKP